MGAERCVCVCVVGWGGFDVGELDLLDGGYKSSEEPEHAMPFATKS